MGDFKGHVGKTSRHTTRDRDRGGYLGRGRDSDSDCDRYLDDDSDRDRDCGDDQAKQAHSPVGHAPVTVTAVTVLPMNTWRHISPELCSRETTTLSDAMPLAKSNMRGQKSPDCPVNLNQNANATPCVNDAKSHDVLVWK